MRATATLIGNKTGCRIVKGMDGASCLLLHDIETDVTHASYMFVFVFYTPLPLPAHASDLSSPTLIPTPTPTPTPTPRETSSSERPRAHNASIPAGHEL
jgi:hypothetical protein